MKKPILIVVIVLILAVVSVYAAPRFLATTQGSVSLVKGTDEAKARFRVTTEDFDTASGSFLYETQGYTVNADVMKIAVVGNTAMFGGPVTESDDPDYPVGGWMIITALDSGRGGSAGEYLWVDYKTDSQEAITQISTFIPMGVQWSVKNGGIRVRN